MELDNSINTYLPIAPSYFGERLFMNATYELPNEMADLFSKGLEALSKFLYENNINPSNFFPINLIFTKDGNLSLTEDDIGTYGRCIFFLIYSIERLINSNNQHMQLFVFIEELIHYYFQTTNETRVKLITLSVVQKVFPEVTFKEVVSWGGNWN